MHIVENRRSRGSAAYSSLASDKVTPRGCATGACCLCCGSRSKRGQRRRSKGADAAMAPSAPITLPAPVPAPAFVNGHALGSAQKVPGKSNLKQTSTIPSTSSNGASSTDVRFGESHEDGERAQVDSERGTKVQWIDNYGKELTQVFEFEPRYEFVKAGVGMGHISLQGGASESVIGKAFLRSSRCRCCQRLRIWFHGA